MSGEGGLRSDRVPDRSRIAIEPLEARTFFSSGESGADTTFGAGLGAQAAESQHHYRHHLHERHHYHQPHTVSPDVLFGHFMGSSTSGAFHDLTDLTLAKDAAGHIGGLLVLYNGFTYDTDFQVTVFSDQTFTLVAAGVNKRGGLRGYITEHRTHTIVLRGEFGVVNAGSGHRGPFVLAKVS